MFLRRGAGCPAMRPVFLLPEELSVAKNVRQNGIVVALPGKLGLMLCVTGANK